MTKERIAELISTYGKNDYYDQASGKIYKFSEMQYHLFHNQTKIPVVDYLTGEDFIITLEGNYETLA